MSKTVAFHTLGCKVNQYDSQAMLERFLQAGYTAVPFDQEADVYVVVTCVVTAAGEQKSRQVIHRVRRRQHDSQLVVAGCLAQKEADALKDLGARLIIGNLHRERVVELLDEAMEKDSQLCAVEDILHRPFEELEVSFQDQKTRGVMKIQEGCDRYCSYCIIPHVRGGIRSRTPENIEKEAKALVAHGHQEIVLTGIHLSSYGRDLYQSKLLDAVRAAARSGVRRLRLGSLEPVIATEDFVKELASVPQVCPQFHLSLQSGSDSVLLRMKRRYTSAEYMKAATLLRAAFPGCALTTDVMVGFPGESEEEFLESMAFCQAVGFSKMHIFPYSRRSGTPADAMKGQLSTAVKKDRAARLARLDEQLSVQYRQGLLGSVQAVLFETESGEGATGYCPQYLPVEVKGAREGQLLPVRLHALSRDGFHGTLIDAT